MVHVEKLRKIEAFLVHCEVCGSEARLLPPLVMHGRGLWVKESRHWFLCSPQSSQNLSRAKGASVSSEDFIIDEGHFCWLLAYYGGLHYGVSLLIYNVL